MLQTTKPRLLERILSNENSVRVAFFLSGMYTYKVIEAIKEQDIYDITFNGLTALLMVYAGNHFIKKIKKGE